MTHVDEGRVVDGLQSMASLGTVLLGIAPYLTAFGVQHKDERFLHEIAKRFPAGAGLARRSGRRVWVTDTFQDINGVAHTIRNIGARSQAAGRPITVMTCLEQPPAAPGLDLVNFKPLGFFALPEYEMQQLAFPPFLEVIERIERSNAYEVIISTPGPLGLTGLLAARLLGLRTCGIYHTDFPRYVHCLTQDEMLEQATWRYMQWFYGSMHKIYVPSECYRRQLTENGFEAAKLQVLPRGVDLERFTPAKRDPAFWTRFGLNGNPKLLYVGRISKEKNIETLLDAFRAVRAGTPNVDLVIVGDGPDRKALEAQSRDPNIAFTGFLHGDELASAYASADLFVFPSATDTFGNVVLEAHASGLPAVVSTHGGPAEIVTRHGSGVAVDVRTPAPMGAAIQALIRDADRRRDMSARAVQTAREHRWERVVEQF
jgi:glycosyltransferase involved in cell wall biosynthesis